MATSRHDKIRRLTHINPEKLIERDAKAISERAKRKVSRELYAKIWEIIMAQTQPPLLQMALEDSVTHSITPFTRSGDFK